MKKVRPELAVRYLGALRTHLRQPGIRNGDVAQGLGRAALAGGLSVVDLARLHDRAVATLTASKAADLSHERAGFFFTQALLPLEAAQDLTRERNRALQQRSETLHRYTAALVKGARRLKREVARRKSGEHVIRRGREKYQRLFQESQLMQRSLRHLARQLLAIQEDERRAISHELHDDVVQTLVGIDVQLSALVQGAAAGAHTLKTSIAQAQRTVRSSVSAVRRFASELRPSALDDLGLIPALHAYCRRLAAREGVGIRLTAFSGVEKLDPARRTVLYRVAQEALNRVAREAQASEVTVTLSKVPGAVRMEIRDDGKSSSGDRAFGAKGHRRTGWVGMRERVEMVGGRLGLKSAAGEGSVVRADVPFGRKPGEK